MTKSEIFKVQKPIGTIGGPILIYNESRSIFSQIPMTQEIAKYMGTDYKIYVKGYVDDKGILQIEEKVKPQGW